MAGSGQTAEERIALETVFRNRLIICIIADVERIRCITCDRSRRGTVKLTAVEARENGAVHKVNSSNASVVVVHCNVEGATTHFHRNGVPVCDVAVGICRVGSPATSCVKMGDDTFSESTPALEGSSTNNQIIAIGPKFIELGTSIVGQAVAGLPCRKPLIGRFIVAKNTIFGSEEDLAVVFNDAANWEFKIIP